MPSSADWPDWTGDAACLAALADEEYPGDLDLYQDPDNAAARARRRAAGGADRRGPRSGRPPVRWRLAGKPPRAGDARVRAAVPW